jgi:low affinity Fe/Cu permease
MPFTLLRRALTSLGVLTAHPAAFVIVAVYTGAWAILEPDTLDWHGAATIATWLMTLLIQRAEHRDTQAIHAKLDELLKADDAAHNHIRKVDEQEPEEIEKARQRS